MATTSPSKSEIAAMAPVVTRDPRFHAGRQLVQTGLAAEGAIDMFGTLLEEVTNKYGESSIETAPVYYEYGNALLRAAMKAQAAAIPEADDDDQAEDIPSNPEDARDAAAEAAEQRQATTTKEEEADETTKPPAAAKSQEATPKEEDDDQKPAAVSSAAKQPEEDENDDGDENDADDQASDEDMTLALEMMENSFSILDEHQECEEPSVLPYRGWIQDQLPRVLSGVGDTLSALERHADAADAYSRALELRQVHLQSFSSKGDNNNNNKNDTLEHLRAHRRACEATVLIAEELLACPTDQDVVTTETSSLIVKAAERVEYARGYYDKARDALQETVYLLGNLASRNIDMGTEKEDVCFIATMVMGVGEILAAIDEEAQESSSSEPVQKKAKT
jgi:tetratricopeptide (TPR) repeat protein